MKDMYILRTRHDKFMFTQYIKTYLPVMHIIDSFQGIMGFTIYYDFPAYTFSLNPMAGNLAIVLGLLSLSSLFSLFSRPCVSSLLQFYDLLRMGGSALKKQLCTV